MSFNWINIISINSSQNDAFEELLCQLARKEPIQDKKEFIKVGNPDGGVECYIVLENGDELGFQAKWFLFTPQDAQWNQIEKSFKTALRKHPNMTKYYVAIPLDRADPRLDNQKWFMDKWNEKVEKWKQFALDTYGKEIDFDYWGSSEFIERLSKEENTGLKKLFFGEIDLSKEWLKNQNELAIKDLGARYTPEINIELDSLLEKFDAISRNEQFKQRVDKAYHEFMVSYREFTSHIRFENEEINKLNSELSSKLESFEKIYECIDFSGVGYINIGTIIQLFEKVQPLSHKISDLLYELNQNEIEDKKIKTHDGYRTSTHFDTNIRDFRNYLSELHEIEGFFHSKSFKFINNPFMLLGGEAGIGKSHLLADIVTQRMNDGYDSIFLLGQQFRSEVHPWSQILKDLLRLDCNESEFLGALNAKAETQNRRIIIFIDAINEGKGRNFWNHFIRGFIESIKQYEWLGLVISIRSSYFDLIIPKEILEQELAIRVIHYGFDGVEYNASKIFFQNYNIAQPSIPLLHPEFSNPLFLKLFCEGLNKKGLTTIPDGYEGITNIIKFFIEGVEAKLEYKYPNIKSLKLINKIIKALIGRMIDTQTLAYDEAFSIIEGVVSAYRLESGLLDDLVSEGLLAKNLFYNDGEYEEGIYFAYERFEDHLKVKFLFDIYLDKQNPKDSFEKEPLKDYVDIDNIYLYRGIVDAMSIQLPEYCDVELIDMASQNEFLIDSFFDSFHWRKAESITETTTNFILKNITGNFQEDIFKVIFSNSSNPKHPLNALFLHEYLAPFSMRDRDVFFIGILNSIYINEEVNSIKRLIDWAWSYEDKSYISDVSLLLTAITLSWFLTTSNRRLRDYSTKALVSILQGRIFILLELLKKFEDIDELYIYERLFAVAYGVVVRMEDNRGLKELGEYIYKTIFDTDEVILHILLRDYAKNTIDYIRYVGIDLDIEIQKIEPPYESYFPKIEELPTNNEIDKYEDNYGNQADIIYSMITEYGTEGMGGYGDFGRYVFGSSLNDFECKKDEQLLSNYVTKKIFEEYGYDGKFFDKSEKLISHYSRRNYDRYSHKIERIGKKYQWIAMYNTLASVTDNFKMYDSSTWGEDKKELQYQGSFEPYVRDIDPTVLLKSTQVVRYDNTEQNFYWNPKLEFQWKMENRAWIEETDDLPSPKNNIEFIDENNQSWITLTSFPEWKEPLKKGYDRSKTSYKSLWYQLRSYLIPKKDLFIFIEWADKKNFYGLDMPKEKGHYQMFNREHYWSEAYEFFKNPYYGGYQQWTAVERGYPYKVALTTDKYYWESEFDYSKEDSLNILKPSQIVFEGLKMKYSHRDGEYRDENNSIVCFEASVYNESHQCLLVKKEELLKFLDENDLTLVWTIIGEKQIITHRHSYEDFIGLLQISGIVNMDENNQFNTKLNIKLMDSDRKESYKKITINDNNL